MANRLVQHMTVEEPTSIQWIIYNQLTCKRLSTGNILHSETRLPRHAVGPLCPLFPAVKPQKLLQARRLTKLQHLVDPYSEELTPGLQVSLF